MGEGAQGKPKVRTGEGCPLNLGKMIGAVKNRSETSPLSCLGGEIGDLERVNEHSSPYHHDEGHRPVDRDQVLMELTRVVRCGGRITIVVGNSMIRGAYVDNAALIESLAGSLGLASAGRRDREIPARRRYLPP